MLINPSKKMMTRSFEKTQYTFREVPEGHFNQAYGIYVHVPFCYTKCSFCPFYKELFSEGLKNQYLDALTKEIRQTDISNESKWIYFGGGTPNTLTVPELETIITTFREKVKVQSIGIELLPAIVTKEYIDGLHSIGFTKISIGIETFSEASHKSTGRKKTTFEHIKEIITHARERSLHVAVDLMVGLPKQDEQTFLDDIQKIIDIQPNQITIYPFMVIRGVAAKPSCSSKEQFQQIEQAAALLTKAGYERKSVWIFILPDTATEDIYDSSKDELVEDYCGFGPASFSTYDNWKVVRPELDVWLENHRTNSPKAFVAQKTKSTDDWRRFAQKIYDLKIGDDTDFPVYIRLFDAILRWTGYYRNG